MRPLSAIGLLLLVIAVTGCVSKSTAEAQKRAAYIAGQRDAMATMLAQQRTSILFNGPVQNREVAWTENLTLSQAIVAAGYTARGTPKEIILTRGNESARIDPQSLLRGAEIPLEPGDTITLR